MGVITKVQAMPNTEEQYFVAGMLKTAQEDGWSAEDLVKMHDAMSALDQHEKRDVVWKKVASDLSEVFRVCGFTKSATMFNLMLHEPKLHDAHVAILAATVEPLKEFEKQASPRKIPGAFTNTLHGALITLAGLGALGGGVAHYAQKRVNEDDVNIEKERAAYNTYLRLVNELDRRATNEAIKQRKLSL